MEIERRKDETPEKNKTYDIEIIFSRKEDVTTLNARDKVYSKLFSFRNGVSTRPRISYFQFFAPSTFTLKY